ncbi:tyrosine-type recombinase/integrase [Brevibacterium linens]|uniref:tyrosine-type recombinase/integrase n=1 Tax=Brevibacterium linens TaxID=1703 RepID=UPI00124B96FF|nr:site-specific integrase [Brevibacterium linens]KAB1947653.1 site-specific integrase [Brevibacterium linens ATCC 9172]
MGNIQKRPNGKWRARFRDYQGKEHSRHFSRRVNAQAWINEQEHSKRSGTLLDPAKGRVSVGEWCDQWLEGYQTNRVGTVRQARTHLKRIKAAFGDRPIGALRPSEVKAWVSGLKAEGLAESTVYALHSRLAQVMQDAVLDGVLGKSPVSKRTAPAAGGQRPFVPTTEQVWAMHDALPVNYRPALLLGAFAGLRAGEICGLRVGDVDFLRGTITPAQQYKGSPLKTRGSESGIPVARELITDLSQYVTGDSAQVLMRNDYGRPVAPVTLQHAWKDVRRTIEGMPESFRIHDLRHYYASLLISQGLDIKTVQKCLRHGSAKTTLDVYGHIWPDKDESARAATSSVFAARADCLRTEGDSAASLPQSE